jgi:hypothetical protein
MTSESVPKFHVRALNVFIKLVTLFAPEDVVTMSFNSEQNTITVQSICQSEQAMFIAKLTGTGAVGDILRAVRNPDSNIHTYKFDSKALQLLLKHVVKSCAVSMDIEPRDCQLVIITRDKKRQPLTKHVLKSIDDGKNSEDFDVDQLVAGLEYPLTTLVEGQRFSRCMGISCEETKIELTGSTLRFTTDHTGLETTMILPLESCNGNTDEEYRAEFGKVATSWLAKVAGVCAYASEVYSTLLKLSQTSKKRKLQKEDQKENNNDDSTQEEEKNHNVKEVAELLKLSLSSTLPLGLSCSLGNNSSLCVYASSRNVDEED